MASNVAIGGECFGGDDLITVRDAEQPFIKGPMTEAAEGQPVAWVVIVADRPGDDVSGIDHGVAIGRAHADAAKGAAMGIGGDHGAPEALITYDWRDSGVRNEQFL